MVKPPSRTCISLALLAWGSPPTFHRPFVSRRTTTTGSFLAAAWSTTALPSFRHTTTRKLSATIASLRTRQLRRMMSTDANEVSTPSSSTIASNLETVRRNIDEACSSTNTQKTPVRLVAVSKTKPASFVLEAYNNADHRVFGENYVQELIEKAAGLPKDISWHFIGPLQSNKAALLVKSVVPHCAALTIETVATLKLANKLNRAMEEVCSDDEDEKKKLNIFVQVNTSGEESKSGVSPDDVTELIRSILDNCPRLNVQGLMTIGAPGDLTCFDTLRECRDKIVAGEEEKSMSNLELSMGMSGDYVDAIARGSTNIRVGSTIFGVRDYSNKK